MLNIHEAVRNFLDTIKTTKQIREHLLLKGINHITPHYQASLLHRLTKRGSIVRYSDGAYGPPGLDFVKPTTVDVKKLIVEFLTEPKTTREIRDFMIVKKLPGSIGSILHRLVAEGKIKYYGPRTYGPIR